MKKYQIELSEMKNIGSNNRIYTAKERFGRTDRCL